MATVKEFGLCVFGATGFTGKFIAEAAARQAQRSASRVRVALAGRDRVKLEAVAQTVRQAVGDVDLGIIVADVNDAVSLVRMAERSAVVISAVGPFRFYGEPVVAACIQGKAHLVDITGEPEYMERMELVYHDMAVAAGVCIVSSCGFDSIPADLGVQFAVDTLKQVGARATAVESFLAIHSGPAGFAGHYATFESAVHGFGSVKDLRNTRKQYIQRHPEAAIVPAYGKPLPKRGQVFWDATTNAWGMPFMGSDAAVVRRTQRLLLQSKEAGTADETVADQLPVQYGAYVSIHSAFYTFLIVMYGIIFSMLAQFAWGRRILLANPKLFSNGKFSHAGPSMEQIRQTSFSIRFFANGYSQAAFPDPGAIMLPKKGGSAAAAKPRVPSPDTTCIVEVRGAEPGYDATSNIVVAAALSVLEDLPAVPARRGVLTPGFALRGTRAMQRLTAAGLQFHVIQAPRTSTIQIGKAQ